MNSKKLFAGVIALAMVVVAMPGTGNAQATAEDLAAQIAQLQAQLASLMGQLGTTTASGVSTTNIAACTGITFTRNLTLGSQGTDVQCLQAMLNQDPATQVAATGVGSAGNETTYFGGLTKAAVVAFQNKYASEVLAPVGLTAGTGFVGASTRAKLNAMLMSTTTTGTTGGTGTTGTTGTTLPEGCTSTAGYSPVTGESCSATTSTGTGLTMTGTEGSITVSINPSPANGTKVYEGDEKVAVMGLKVKATGSDVDVQRVTLQFGVQPYSYFGNVYLYDGDTQVASSALNSTTVSKVTSTNYQITLAGFTSKVIVPVNTDKVLTVKLDVLPGISSGLFDPNTTSKTINIGMPSATAVRAVDQAGLNQYGGVAYADANRSFTANASQSANATLSLSLNANTPKKRNIIGDSNQEITGATLMTFDLKANKDDLIVDEILDVDFGASQIPATAYVVDDGGNVIGTISPSTTVEDNDFTELDYTISKGTTKTLSVKIDDTLAAPDANHESDDDEKTYTVAIGSGKVGFTKTNGTTGTSTGTATSNAATIYAEGPVFAITGIATENTQAPYAGASSTLSATFNINVKAENGDVFLSKTAAFDVLSTTGVATSTVTDITYNIPSNVVEEGGAYKIAEGNDATFAVKATVSNGGVSGTYDLRISSITWGHVSGTLTVVSSYMKQRF